MIAPALPRTRPRGRGRIPALLLVCLLAGISPGALSAVIEVDTLDDVVDGGDGLCSLREAIDNANDDLQTHADCEAGATGGDTIRLAQTQAMYDALTGDLELAGAELVVNDAGDTPGESLTIDGLVTDPSSSDDPPPERTLTINGGGDSESDASACVTTDSRVGRILSVQTPTTLTDLTLRDACIQDLDGALIFNASALTLTDVDLLAGNALGSEASGGGRGGAIFNDAGATLAVETGQITSSFASRAGGGIASLSTATIAGGCPLAVLADCTISLDGVTLSNNLAGLNDTVDGGSGTLLLGSGGGLYNAGGAVAGEAATVSSNLATVSGGGIWNSGTVGLRNAILQSNQAQALTQTLNDQDPRGGGAIFNEGGNLDITFAVLSGNSVVHNDVFQAVIFPAVYGGAVASTGGALDFDTVGMTQNQAGQAEAKNDSNEVVQPLIPGLGGALYVGAGSVTIVDSTLFNNVAQTDGGAIWHGGAGLDMQRTTVQNNTARGGVEQAGTATGGGGLYNDGAATILGGRFYGNVADGQNATGGGIIHAGGSLAVTDTEIGRNFAAFGGGIDNGGTLTLSRVFLGAPQTESRNVANTNGGGLYNRSGADATVDDTAIAFNDATRGGGIWNAGALNVTNSTFSNDRAVSGGTGGSLFQDGGNATLRFTTAAGGNVVAASDAADVVAESSLITSAAGGSVNADGFSVLNPGNPGLNALQLYGGPTPTRPLTANSPALEAGNTADCPAADQRGATRPFNSDCDAGGFERTDDPVLTVERNGPEGVTVDSGQDLVVLAFSLTNDGGESVAVDGFDMRPLFNGGVEAVRRLVGNDPDAVGQLQFEVVLDNGADENAGNGLLDADETTVVGSGDWRTLDCVEVQCSIAAGGSEDFLVVLRLSGITTAGLSFAPPIFAGGLLIGLIGLVRLRGLRRRAQWLLVLALLTAGLTACSKTTDIDNIEPPPPPVPDPSLFGQLRFKLYRLDSNVAGQILIGDGLPVYGPQISVP